MSGLHYIKLVSSSEGAPPSCFITIHVCLVHETLVILLEFLSEYNIQITDHHYLGFDKR